MSIQWDFEKGLLVFMAVLVLGAAGVSFWKRAEAQELVSRQRASEEKLANIGRRAEQIGVLKEEIRRDPVAKGVRAFTYLEQQMIDSRIGKKFQVDGGRQPREFDGYTDHMYALSSKERGGFSREAICKFLLFVEGNTSRMKVTRIKLDAAEKKTSVVQEWRPTIEVTDRQAAALEP